MSKRFLVFMYYKGVSQGGANDLIGSANDIIEINTLLSNTYTIFRRNVHFNIYDTKECRKYTHTLSGEKLRQNESTDAVDLMKMLNNIFEDTNSKFKHFLVATRCGGEMGGDASIFYDDYKIVEANNKEEALELYNKTLKCSYYYGNLISKLITAKDISSAKISHGLKDIDIIKYNAIIIEAMTKNKEVAKPETIKKIVAAISSKIADSKKRRFLIASKYCRENAKSSDDVYCSSYRIVLANTEIEAINLYTKKLGSDNCTIVIIDEIHRNKDIDKYRKFSPLTEFQTIS